VDRDAGLTSRHREETSTEHHVPRADVGGRVRGRAPVAGTRRELAVRPHPECGEVASVADRVHTVLGIDLDLPQEEDVDQNIGYVQTPSIENVVSRGRPRRARAGRERRLSCRNAGVAQW
jgi:hypothetical protein